MRSTKSCFNGMALTIFLMLKNLNIQILEFFGPLINGNHLGLIGRLSLVKMLF